MVQLSLNTWFCEENTASFEFFVYVEKLTTIELHLRFNFSNPLRISIGKRPDTMEITVKDTNLFVSKYTGKTMIRDALIEVDLPRQFPDDYDSLALVSNYSNALEVSYTSTSTASILFTFLLGVTLKPLWHFKNAMQISSYLRHVAYMPANVNEILDSMNDAVTFKPVYDWVVDTGVTKVNKHKDEIR